MQVGWIWVNAGFAKSAPFLCALQAALRRLKSPDTPYLPGAAGDWTRLNEDGRLHVYIYLSSFTPELLQILRDHDAKIGLYDPAQKLISAFIKPEAVNKLASLPFVRLIDLPVKGYTQ